MSEPEAIAVMRQFRERLLSLDRAAAAELVNAYGPVYVRLAERIESLTAEIMGKQLSFEAAQQLPRMKELLAQIDDQIMRYSRIAAGRITEAQQAAVGLAQVSARATAEAALPPGINMETLARAGVSWNTLPSEAFQTFVGISGDGAPLGRLLAALGPEVRTGVTDAIGAGIALGYSPRETAEQIRQKFGMALTRSLRISRTETMRAHRRATQVQFAANRAIVKGYVRRAARNAETCMACIAEDGKEFETDEPFPEHVNGRCVLIPQTIGYRDLGLPVDDVTPPMDSARDWFSGLSEPEQITQMGADRFEAWKAGQFRLEDMAKRHEDRVWGPSITEKSLKELVK